MSKCHLIIDVERCMDCNNCFLACKDEFVENEWKGYSAAQPRHGQRWVNILRKERGRFPLIDVAYLPVPCMHCADAPCVRKAGEGEVYRREDGIVIIDPEKAVGKKDLVKACPYGAIWWNEERNAPQKCTLCAHLLDKGWERPRCVQACPSGAMRFVRAEDPEMGRVIEDEQLEVLHPEYRTNPSVYYRNLHRYFKCFVAGSIAFKKNGLVDCAAGATVVLKKGGREIREAVTDAFGDFKLDGLDERSGAYTLEILYGGHENVTLEIDLKESTSLPAILIP